MTRRCGALISGNSGTFIVWAPFAQSMAVKIISPPGQLVAMEQEGSGYWKAVVSGLAPGSRYYYRLDDDRDRPDPASHFQPEGVHGPSQVVDHAAFCWTDRDWRGIPPASMIIYELHTGTFTPEGTFEAVIARLKDLKELGVNAVELMPVAQFPGARNWGYDGAYPYAVQNSYGGPEGLKRLVNACHIQGIAVVLDVVYNHLGPEGNYLWDYGPYFTDRYCTPWGRAINFDGPYSDEVRSYFIGNALHWITDFHIDALRIDAIHGIFDFSAKHVLRELGEAVHADAASRSRNGFVILESDLNDVRFIAPVEAGGYGLDAQWNDDFHHALHTLITGERTGYYEDFGKIEQMEKALREGFVYSGEFSRFRKRRHGNDSRGQPPHRFVVFSQNHDQVGNRMLGERLSKLAGFEALKLAAAAVILSPNIPLFFMGEEYGEVAPFRYFVSHGDKDLVEAVRKGRGEEFKDFSWAGEPPDPQAEETFRMSKLDWSRRDLGHHHVLLRFYKSLVKFRRETPAFALTDRAQREVGRIENTGVITLRKWTGTGASHVFSLFNFDANDLEVPLTPPPGPWKRALDSSGRDWNGSGTLLPERITDRDQAIVRGHSAVVYVRE